MAKTLATTTISPLALATGVEIFAEDARAVLEQMNHSFAHFTETHVSLGTGAEGYDGGSAEQVLDVRFPSSSGWNTRLAFRIAVPADTQQLIFGARAYMSAAQQGQVRVTVGAAAAVTLTTFTNGTNGVEHTGSVNTSSSGTGDIDVTVEINHTSGSATDCYLRNFRLAANAIAAADLADPEDA